MGGSFTPRRLAATTVRTLHLGGRLAVAAAGRARRVVPLGGLLERVTTSVTDLLGQAGRGARTGPVPAARTTAAGDGADPWAVTELLPEGERPCWVATVTPAPDAAAPPDHLVPAPLTGVRDGEVPEGVGELLCPPGPGVRLTGLAPASPAQLVESLLASGAGGQPGPDAGWGGCAGTLAAAVWAPGEHADAVLALTPERLCLAHVARPGHPVLAPGSCAGRWQLPVSGVTRIRPALGSADPTGVLVEFADGSRLVLGVPDPDQRAQLLAHPLPSGRAQGRDRAAGEGRFEGTD